MPTSTQSDFRDYLIREEHNCPNRRVRNRMHGGGGGRGCKVPSRHGRLSVEEFKWQPLLNHTNPFLAFAGCLELGRELVGSARLKVFFPWRHSISRFRNGAKTLVRSGNTTQFIGWQCVTASSSCNGMALTKHLLFELASDRWC